jgi:CDP-paratose 2-epimerase
MTAKLLITGVCGFVGSTLAREWIAANPGITIYGMDNFIRPGSEKNRMALRKLGIKLFHGDIRIPSDLEMLPPVDWVIDAAANPQVLAGIDGRTTSRQLIEHNLFGTTNLLEYCRRHAAGFVLLSTSRVYSIKPLSNLLVDPVNQAFRPREDQAFPAGMSTAGVCENFSTQPPVSLYGSTKLASEILACEYGEAFDVPVWINRCGVLAGAGQFGKPDQGIFSYWINAYLRRRPLKYIGFGGNGFQVRDCLHPRDLIPLLQKQTATACGHDVRIVNIGGGKGYGMSLAQLSAWCANRFGSHFVASEPDMRRFDIPWLVLDCSLAEQTWDWRPETSLEDILDEIASHAQQHPNWLEISGYYE